MSKGHIHIVSTGVGGVAQMTQSAVIAIEKSDLIVGYTKYINDISSIIKDKEVYSTGMTQEVERCKYVVEQALNGRKVALISNGDANVYGMSGLLLEIVEENKLWDKIDIAIEPGISSVFGAASKAGAPIMTDLAIVSLSNLLTPIELIEHRLKNSLEAEFVLGIYNPLSFTRKEPYEIFLRLIENFRKPETPVIIAQNLGREDEKITVTSVGFLLEIRDNIDEINMSTILIVGNSSTRVVNEGKYVVTQRGYQKNYDYKLN